MIFLKLYDLTRLYLFDNFIFFSRTCITYLCNTNLCDLNEYVIYCSEMKFHIFSLRKLMIANAKSLIMNHLNFES